MSSEYFEKNCQNIRSRLESIESAPYWAGMFKSKNTIKGNLNDFLKQREHKNKKWEAKQTSAHVDIPPAVHTRKNKQKNQKNSKTTETD
jgi:hypothetical protein